MRLRPEIDGIVERYAPELQALVDYYNSDHCTGGASSGSTPATIDTMPRPAIIEEENFQCVSPRQGNCVVTLRKFWELRAKRQAEIDQVIAKHADTETLYDQPDED